MFDAPLTWHTFELITMLRFAEKGIPPGEYKKLTVAEREMMTGIMAGESTGWKHRRGKFD